MNSTDLKTLSGQITLVEMQVEMSDLDGGNSAYYKKQLAELKVKKEKIENLTTPDIDITY